MRDNLKKAIGVVLLLILMFAALSAFFQRNRAGNIQQAVAETRRTLREQGFKTDLADFNLTTDSATRSREAALTFFGSLQPMLVLDTVDLLPTVADGSAVVVWKQDWVNGGEGNFTWSDLHDALEENRPQLDAACDAALSGPIQFDLEARRGGAMLLRHLSPLNRLGQSLGMRMVMELRDGNPDAAWTNLLALTRLATAWNVEPAEVSHLVRFRLVDSGFNAAWQALQNGRWPEEKLAGLQHEWESADFFTNLPDTVAFQRASDVAMCQQQRQEPLAAGKLMSEIIKESVHAPGAAVSAIKVFWAAARYRNYGTYDDEKNLLLFYQQREIEMRHAIVSPTWMQMRTLPGVTNMLMFTSSYQLSRMTFMMNVHARSMRLMNQNSSLLGNAAMAETRRRIIVTAIALERFRQKHGAYPQTLAGLVPEFLKAAPVDFMDGQPLRYRLAENGHFVLYSVGLDCVDNGGMLPPPSSRPMRGGALGVAGPSPTGDIVWPFLAGAEAVAAQHEQEMAVARAKADELEELQASAQWEHTTRHQADLDVVLAAPPVTNLPDIEFHGHPLSEVLCNRQTAGTNKLSLVKLLTLNQIMTGSEPETITFELPIAYDVITNLGELQLYIDPTNNDDSDMGCNVMDLDCTRATNGDSLLVWGTIYESPGRHALQAGLFLNELPPDRQDFDGPLLPFTTTNLCQFSLVSQHFDPGVGAVWHARLPEANAGYIIELNTTSGKRLKTISGSTSNAELKVFWNLVDDRGQRFAGDEFSSVFRLTFPDSGRTQTLRGP